MASQQRHDVAEVPGWIAATAAYLAINAADYTVEGTVSSYPLYAMK